MHFTLHLTDACNMACSYCYVQQDVHTMTADIAKRTVRLAADSGNRCGIIFFGGEPLLCKDLIYETVAYGDALETQSPARFAYKITTNGLLLDDEFLAFSAKHQVFIALSHDGVREAHDANRVGHDGKGTFEEVEAAARRLLSFRPYAPVMMTVSPSTVQHYAAGVAHLFDLGFRYLICSLNYAGDWDAQTLEELRRQYRKLARFYEEKTLAEEKFYLSPFEVKLASHIRGDCYKAERCELGLKQVSVAPDGTLYPCVQFVGQEMFRIGDVWQGIREEDRMRLYEANEEEKESCSTCAVRMRCNHHCACLNQQATGDYQTVSPVLCAHERMLIPIADKLAERLYKKRSAWFIQKQYNDVFPLLSLVEDKVDLDPVHGKARP